ncbi:hypothetical protein LO762_12525 [Actinocorallia sp. API 0066]|uniref:hypothetical protein n=1 Tax=Actinocorallia sp. API 0066 TaxID=2896846 RepID=UPI001E38BBF2|nr:hypothetical protein [Actinocorallia sp. API 0066]MCD0450011.1 hypothetical protein [Actinocorallia sp. API 0066]
MHPYRGLFAVDIEDYSGNSDNELPVLHRAMLAALDTAFSGASLADVWEAGRPQTAGDSVFLLVPHEALPPLVHPFPDLLQGALSERARALRADGLGLRLRMALHVGAVDDTDPVTAGISTATNEVHRLLDCEPVREALKGSHPDVTRLAVCLSARVYEDVVVSGASGLHPSRLEPVRARVKRFDQTAYLYVPVPSRREPPSPAAGQTAEPDPAPSGPLPSGLPSWGPISVQGDGVNNAVGNWTQGSFHQGRS